MTITKHAGNLGLEIDANQGAETFVPVALQLVATDAENEEKLRTPIVFKSFDLVTATAETTLWTPAAGKKFRLMGLILTTSAVTTLKFRDGTGGTIVFQIGSGANVPLNPCDMGNGILSALANNLLTVTRSITAVLVGTVWGTEE